MVSSLSDQRFCLPSLKHCMLKLVLLLFPFVLNAQRFVHPGIPFTQYDLDQLKQNITKEPWLSDYNAFKNDPHSQLSYAMRGPVANVSRAPNLNNTLWMEDMVAIHHLAFMWIFTGDSAYARKATDMLDAWAVTNTTWGGNENMLDIGDYAQYWATGADILKSTFPGWTAANTQHVDNYFANVLYPTSWVPYPLRDQNKGALQLKIALGAAAFLDDTAKFNQAIEVYRMDAGGGMRNSLPNGEVGDAGRDDHWRVQAAALAWGAEVAYKQGIDMFSELNNRVLAIGELYHKYAFDGDTMTFIPFGGYASYWTAWGIKPGAVAGDMTNIIYSAYNVRKGIPTPYTDKMRAAVGGSGGDFLFLKTSDTSTAVTLPQVVYPGDNVQPVTHLTNMDIGNTGMAGSAVYNNGAWMVKGAGTSLSNSFNYTFQKMSGNSALIVRVDSMSQSAGACGLMVRQSLTAGSAYWNIELEGTGGIGRHWQPKAPWWMKIERVGTRIFAYHSQDGINWTNLLCFYEPDNYTDSLYYGFYAISNNASAVNAASFSHVAFSAATAPGAPVFTSNTQINAHISDTFSYTITASNNPTAFRADNLPPGLNLDSSTGVLSGRPAAMGTYTVTLYATNSSGTSTDILIVQVSNNVAPAAPSNLTEAVINTDHVQLNWTASANATTYTVKRSLNSGGPYQAIATGVTTNSYTDINPVPEKPNYYIVTALADTLESGISNEVSAVVPPGIPGKPDVTLGSNQLTLNWTPGDGAKTYNVKRSSVTGGPYTTIASGIADTTYTDTSVVNGTPYYYVISSVGTSLESGTSLEGFGVPGASAFTWTYSPVDSSMSNASNWVEQTVPTSPAILTFKVTEDSTLNNDLTNLSTSRIVFDTTATGYTISGNPINAGNEIINNSSVAQALNTPIVMNSDLVTNANTQDIVLGGAVSGAGNFKNIGRNNVYMNGLNTYTGNTTIWGDGSGAYVLKIAGNSTGAPSAPTAGPLGTGKIIMDGGSLQDGDSDAVLYNDIEVLPGKRSYIYEGVHAITLYGKITGSGTFWADCNTYAGLHLFGDNSGFTGLFVNALRSGNNRLRFESPDAGSANATWNLDANGIDCQSLDYGDGTIHFGALTGRGYFRNDGGGSPIISVGALNTSTWFSGTINGAIGLEKVGTGDWEIGGNHTYSLPTTIRGGSITLVNDPVVGTFTSPLTVVAGSFVGTGRTTATVTIGTGSGTGASLEPGYHTVGTLTTTAALTMLQDATYKVEMNFSTDTADQMVAGSIILDSAILQPIVLGSDNLANNRNFTIINNIGTDKVSGAFKGLPELTLITIDGHDFRITYRGGDGNDVVLLNNAAAPAYISNSDSVTGLLNKPFSFQVTAVNNPTAYSATGLPTGLSIDANTGLVSGTPQVAGVFNVKLGTTNANGIDSFTLILTVQGDIVQNLFVGSGDAKDTLYWNPVSASLIKSFNVKRAEVSGGPYTTLGNTLTNGFIDNTAVNGKTYYYVVSMVDASAMEYPNSYEVTATPNAGQYAYYSFNDGDSVGVNTIDSWGGHTGTVMSSATRIAGYNGNGVSLNGTTTSYVNLPAGLMNGVTDFSITAWVKPGAVTTWQRIFDFGSGTTNYMFLTASSGSTVRYAINTGGGEQVINSTGLMATGIWHHVAVTQAGKVATLYIDGVQVGQNTNMTLNPSSLAATTQNYIGKSQFNDPLFNGMVDEFHIYNRALSVAEIQAQVPPAAPANLSVKGGNNADTLQWDASSLATSYNVKRSDGNEDNFVMIATVSDTTFVDNTVTNCNVYYYKVTAVSSVGEGLPGNEASTSWGQQLQGTLIGTDGSYGNNSATTKAAAVDGNLNTFFDATAASGAWVGYDFGSDGIIVRQIRYAPRNTYAARMTGGVFQGANNADFSDAVTIFTVPAAPANGVLTTQMITGNTAYRYVRYLSPANGYCNVAEVQFVGLAAKSPVLTSDKQLSGSAGVGFSYSIIATPLPSNFTATGLPDGLTIDGCAGIISGTPTTAGSYQVPVTISNYYGTTNETLGITITSGNVMPVNWSYFRGTSQGMKAQLQWGTATEINTKAFGVERSNDNKNYTQVGVVQASDNSTKPKEYGYMDALPSTGVYYYRLKENGADGNSNYSKVITVSVSGDNTNNSAYPNPAKSYVYIPGAQSGKVLLFDISGRQYQVSPPLYESGKLKLDIHNVPAGSYIIQVHDNNNAETYKILIAH